MDAWRGRLGELLALEHGDLDRLALALGLAARLGTLPPDLAARAAAPAAPRRGPRPEGDLAELLDLLAPNADPDELRARGEAILAGLLHGAGDDPWAAVEALLAAFASPPADGASPVPPGSAIRVPVARNPDGGTVHWTINEEGGHQGAPHAGIAGMTGHGKSQLLLQVLAAIARQAPATGLVVLDYKGDLSKAAEFLDATGCRVIRPGQEPLPLNPFHLPSDDTRPQLVAGQLAAVLARTSRGSLGDVQRMRAEEALSAAYEEHGLRPPLQAVLQAVEARYARDRVQADQVLATVRKLATTGLFQAAPTDPPEAFLSGRWIVDLHDLQGFETLVALVLLHHIHQVVRSLPDAPASRGTPTVREMRTVIAIDEAHYYLRGRAEPLLDLVRVGRSKGTAVILSTQSVADFKDHDVLQEQLPTLFLFHHKQAPPYRTLQGLLGLADLAAARQASDALLALNQFQALTTVAGADGPRRVEVLPFFRNLGLEEPP